MPGFSFAGSKNRHEELEVARAEAPKFERVKWWTQPNMRALYFWACILMVASATTGYDGMMLNSSQNMDSWQIYFNHPSGNQLGVMNAAYQIGSICSMPFVPYMCDWWGRKIPIATGCLIMILGGFVGAFANGWGMYMAGRIVLGFGNTLAQLASPTLLTEICHPQHRGVVTAIYNCLWNLGAVVVAAIAYGTAQVNSNWSWRSITLIQIFPSVIQIVFIYWVPESPRWLISKGRHDDALKILAHYHASGNSRDATVQFEYREITETIALEQQARKESHWLDFLRTKGNRHRLAILISLGIISQYSGNALFSNYQNIIYNGAGITQQNQKLGLSFGNTLLSLVVSISASSVIDRFGRRPMFLIATGGMVITFVCWTISSAVYENSGARTIFVAGAETTVYSNQGAGDVQIVFIWLFGVAYSLAWSGLLVGYTLEILPYKLRSKGLMIMNITVQAILAIGNQTNPLAWENLPHHWNFTLFYTLWICVEFAFVYFFYVETKGPTLEEIARIFDGDDAIAHIDIHEVEKDLLNPPSDLNEKSAEKAIEAEVA